MDDTIESLRARIEALENPSSGIEKPQCYGLAPQPFRRQFQLHTDVPPAAPAPAPVEVPCWLRAPLSVNKPYPWEQ